MTWVHISVRYSSEKYARRTAQRCLASLPGMFGTSKQFLHKFRDHNEVGIKIRMKNPIYDQIDKERRIEEVVQHIASKIKRFVLSLDIEIYPNILRVFNWQRYAWIRRDGRLFGRTDGTVHRLSGPAWIDGIKEWFIDGIEVPRFDRIKTNADACKYMKKNPSFIWVIKTLAAERALNLSPEFIENTLAL